jgi:hypothetical protein
MDPELEQTLTTYNQSKQKHRSIRCLNYFVVNFSKTTCVVLPNGLNVYQEYQTMLKHFRRKSFDPFRRGTPIYFQNQYTTKGQILFFKWASTTGILKYFEAHAKDVNSHLIDVSYKHDKKKHHQGQLDKKSREFLCDLHPCNQFRVVSTHAYTTSLFNLRPFAGSSSACSEPVA